jgi:hypothetical protein
MFNPGWMRAASAHVAALTWLHDASAAEAAMLAPVQAATTKASLRARPGLR